MVAVVAMVRRSVPVPEASEGVARLHVAGLVAFAGPVMAQVRSTVSLNPPDGVKEMVEVLPVVAPATKASVAGLELMVNVPLFAAAVTVALTVVGCVFAPEVAVTVTI